MTSPIHQAPAIAENPEPLPYDALYMLSTRNVVKLIALVIAATAEECARIVCQQSDGFIFTAQMAGVVASVRAKLAEAILDKYQEQTTSGEKA